MNTGRRPDHVPMHGDSRRPILRAGLPLILFAFLLSASGRGQNPSQDIPEAVREAGNRFLAHVSTDKPIYKPGETLYVRVALLQALTRQPHPGPVSAKIEVISPRGDVAGQGFGAIEKGSFGWQWPIDSAIAGGDYKIRVTFPRMAYPPAEREFNIRAYRVPRFRTQIEFAREGYGPGDEATAILSVTRVEGGVPVGAKAAVVARVDQQEVYRGEAVVDAEGFAIARFPLPKVIAFGDGTITFSIEDGGVVDTAAKTIPILVATVDLQVYPEGGELVPGWENRVYFEAIAPNGRPADVTAELRDNQGRVVLTAKTEHEGRGRFVFTPDAGSTYTLQVVEPWTVKTSAALPQPVGRVVLRSSREVYSPGEPIALDLGAARPGEFRVALFQRDLLLMEQSVSLGASDFSWRAVRFDIPKSVCGVLRATVFDQGQGGLPVAERLVFRKAAGRVKVKVEVDREAYVPGDSVTLSIKTTDEDGKPIPAVVGLTVTDDGTLEMVETREQPPRLPVMAFLEPEVRKLADAWIYLSSNEKAAPAVDLLLGTQGWRRFAYVEPAKFRSQAGDAALRVLAEAVPWVDDLEATYYLARRERLAFGRDAGMAGGPLLVGDFAAARAPHKGVRAAPVGGPNVQQGIEMPEAEVAAPVVDKPRDLKDERPLAPAEQAREKMAQGGRGVLRKRFGEAAGAFYVDQEYAVGGPGSLMPVRVYAHAVRPGRQTNDRVDFAQTLYWNAGLATDEKGEAAVLFNLSDSVTSFRVLADAYAADGRIGSGEAVIESRRPFYVEAKIPLEVTAGDTVQLPVVMVNETANALSAAVDLAAGNGITFGEFTRTVSIPAHARVRVVVPVTVEPEPGTTELTVTASAGDFQDVVKRPVSIKPLGFPVSVSFGGLLEGESAHTLAIPESLTEGGITARAAVYPSPLANLTSALEALIRDPNGCFEQTSSTNYPLVMALQYFSTHEGVAPDLVARSREKLDAGYKRLVGFECKSKGYEWFGGDPGHEALTAYGLLEFSDMAAVHPVDPQMLERTRQWLLGRRDGKGGFTRNPKALDSFGGAPDDVTNAYIIWALACAGEKDLAKELDALRESAAKSEDPYIMALAAGALAHAGRGEEAAPLLKRLAALQGKDGAMAGAKTTITRSGGQSLLIETTSLAVLAWVTDPAYAGNVEQAMKWLCAECEGGRFGSTQSTVLALKAIVEYDKARTRPVLDGAVSLVIDGKTVEEIAFTKDRKQALEFKSFGHLLLPGSHSVALRMKDGSPMPYSLSVEYHAEKPNDVGACPLELQTRIAETQVKEGDPVEIVARIRNTTKNGLPMTMVLVGLPGGLEPRHERLKELVKEGKFDFYEVLGRDVAIYFRDLGPNEEHEVVISTIAAVPGEYTGPASRAYLYYTPEEKRWQDGVRVTVAAK